MSQNLYITGAEHNSGKSIVALAMMEVLTRNVEIVGFFRPVIHSLQKPDNLTRLLSGHYRLRWPEEAMYGCTADEARDLIADNRYDALLKRILEKYKALEDQCESVLCVGTDFSGVHSVLEFDFNADMANNLACSILPVVNGHARTVNEVIDATATFLRSLLMRDCDIFASVINRVAPEIIDAVSHPIQQQLHPVAPVYLVPEEATLGTPTVGDVAQALGATILYGETDQLNREIRHIKVAAMHVPDFLTYIEAGSLIITPGDRADIILASLMSHPSTRYPQIAGLLLSGGQLPAASLIELIKGLEAPPVAILGVDTDTFTTTLNTNAVKAVLRPENEHKIATALGLMERSIDIPDLEQRLSSKQATRMTPLMFEHILIQRAKSRRQRIVLPEGDDERILRAAEILHLREVVDIVLLGDPETISNRILQLGLQLDAIDIINPQSSSLRQHYAETYYQLRQHKGISQQMALDAMTDVSYFGTMMVHLGDADGMVSGAVHTTQHTIRPAFEIIRTRPDTKIVSSVFFMCLEDQVLVYGDCAINPNPDAHQLADIAVTSASTARMFGIEPRIAMLSYSTGDSGKGQSVEKVREATHLVKESHPEVKLEGPIQYDAAVDASVAKTKMPGSEVAGHATVFIFPDLNTGNNTYKAVQRSAGAVAIGPILQGLNKPVNDLSRGCTVADIVNTIAITAIQAQTSGQST